MFKYTLIFLRSCDFNNKSLSSDFSIINIFCSQSSHKISARIQDCIQEEGKEGAPCICLE